MKTKQKLWRPPIEKWYKVDINAYKIIYEEGKQRLEEKITESESITNKSFKVIAALGVFGSFFISELKNDVKNEYVLSAVLILYAFSAFLLVTLLSPKDIRERGLAPAILFPKNLDAPDDEGFQEQMVYYSAIVIIQDNITIMSRRNIFRSTVYTCCLVMFAIIILLIMSDLDLFRS